MPKIKISGLPELITISQDKAKRISKAWLDKAIGPDEKFDMGTFVCTKSQIKAIFLDEEKPDGPDLSTQRITEYYQWRDGLLTMPPRKRAEACGAWGYFCLFYGAVKNEQPDEVKWKEKVYVATTEFFEKNPEWGKPSFEVFKNMLQLNNNSAINGEAMKIIARIQDRELQDIQQTKDYESGKLKKESPIVGQSPFVPAEDITSDELPF